MQLGKVCGNVVSTCKADNLEGIRLLLVSHLNDQLEPTGKYYVCTDTVNARIGNVVLTCSSSSARMTSKTKDRCTDLSIVGIVDILSQKKKNIFNQDQ